MCSFTLEDVITELGSTVSKEGLGWSISIQGEYTVLCCECSGERDLTVDSRGGHLPTVISEVLTDIINEVDYYDGRLLSDENDLIENIHNTVIESGDMDMYYTCKDCIAYEEGDEEEERINKYNTKELHRNILPGIEP